MIAAHEHQTGAVNATTATLPEVPSAPENARTESGVLSGVQPGGPEGVSEAVAGAGQAGLGAQPLAPDSIPRPQRSIGEQRAFIANDVSQKLIAAGRPAEEADASGQLIAARYVTRAGRFEGKLGTPEELYAKESADIASPKGLSATPQAKEMAQGAEPKELFQAAYHGSPYDFDAFDTGKIGTGEGAQVYGHGLYFAENEKVARGYQEKLSGDNKG